MRPHQKRAVRENHRAIGAEWAKGRLRVRLGFDRCDTERREDAREDPMLLGRALRDRVRLSVHGLDRGDTRRGANDDHGAQRGTVACDERRGERMFRRRLHGGHVRRVRHERCPSASSYGTSRCR
jgi:hypothetical protein